MSSAEELREFEAMVAQVALHGISRELATGRVQAGWSWSSNVKDWVRRDIDAIWMLEDGKPWHTRLRPGMAKDLAEREEILQRNEQYVYRQELSALDEAELPMETVN